MMLYGKQAAAKTLEEAMALATRELEEWVLNEQGHIPADARALVAQVHLFCFPGLDAHLPTDNTTSCV